MLLKCQVYYPIFSYVVLRLYIRGSVSHMFKVVLLLHKHQCVSTVQYVVSFQVNPLSPKLNPICYLLALLAHHFLHISRIRVKSLTFRLLMPYIYGAPILDVSRSHTTTQHSR